MFRIIQTFLFLTIFGFSHLTYGQFVVSPNTMSAGPSSGTSIFSVSSGAGWNVTDDISWLTSTKTNGSSITVSCSASYSSSSRTAQIISEGMNGLSVTVTLTQAGELASSVTNIDNSSLKIYPNPSSGKIYITSSNYRLISPDVAEVKYNLNNY